MPSSIAISALTTTHPKVLHNLWVRSSLRLSTEFNLAMVRSPGFGSCPCDECITSVTLINKRGRKRYTNGLLTLAFTLHALQRRLCKPHRTNSLAHSSIGTPSPLTRLRLFVSIWFQVLFHLPQRDAFHLSLTVLVHYRS